MAKQEDTHLRVMKQGIALAIRESATGLERVAGKLDRVFEGLDAKKLPEYQTALQAIKAYKTALVAQFERKYKESARESAPSS